MTTTDPLDFLLERSGAALALLDVAIDAARDGDLMFGAWYVLNDPGDFDDFTVRSAITLVFAAGLEGAPAPTSIDAAATPRGWWPLLTKAVAVIMAALVSAEFSLPAVRRREVEPTDWNARLLLWLLATAFAAAEGAGLPRPGQAT